MPDVPTHPHHLPPGEPVPATPWGPNPDYGDLPQRAGDLALGDIKDITPDNRIFYEYEPIKHLHPGPLGFAPEEADDGSSLP